MKEHCLKALWLCPCVQACLMLGGGVWSHKWGVLGGVEISLATTFPNVEIILPSVLDAVYLLHHLKYQVAYKMQQLRKQPSRPKMCRRSPIFLQRMPKIQRRERIISIKYTVNISCTEARKRIQSKPVTYASIATKHTQEIGTQTYFPAQPFTKPNATPPNPHQHWMRQLAFYVVRMIWCVTAGASNEG